MQGLFQIFCKFFGDLVALYGNLGLGVEMAEIGKMELSCSLGAFIGALQTGAWPIAIAGSA
jgi:hypothetical protein